MIRRHLYLLLILFYIPSQVFAITETQIDMQQQDQDTCRKEFYAQCLSQCEKTNDVVCTQACELNAINQCRQAGE